MNEIFWKGWVVIRSLWPRMTYGRQHCLVHMIRARAHCWHPIPNVPRFRDIEDLNDHILVTCFCNGDIEDASRHRTMAGWLFSTVGYTCFCLWRSVSVATLNGKSNEIVQVARNRKPMIQCRKHLLMLQWQSCCHELAFFTFFLLLFLVHWHLLL